MRKRTTKTKGQAPQVTKLPPLPSIYRVSDDHMAIRVRNTINLVNTAAGFASYLMILKPQTMSLSSGYFSLGTEFPILASMAEHYSRFMIRGFSATMVPTTAATGGGYVALGFEPDDSSASGPPASLSDVTNAVHSDVAQVTEQANITFNVSDYFNDWKSTYEKSGNPDSLSQAGVVQFWSSNSNAISTGVALVQVELDMHFVGYRKR
jgi:hypothetical protein